MDLIVDVPEEFALLLFADDLAGLPLRDRSAGAVAQAVVEVLGVTANVTSVVVAVAEFPEIARRLLAWVHRSSNQQGKEAPANEIRVSTPKGFEIQVVIPSTDDSAAIEVTVAEVRTALQRVADEQVA